MPRREPNEIEREHLLEPIAVMLLSIPLLSGLSRYAIYFYVGLGLSGLLVVFVSSRCRQAEVYLDQRYLIVRNVWRRHKVELTDGFTLVVIRGRFDRLVELRTPSCRVVLEAVSSVLVHEFASQVEKESPEARTIRIVEESRLSERPLKSSGNMKDWWSRQVRVY